MIFSFTLAVFFLLITPGPGVLSTAGVGAGFGFRPGLRYVIGLCIGSNTVMLSVATGLAAVLLANPTLRVILLAGSTAYLLWMAARIALAGSNIAFAAAKTNPGLRDGVLLQIINPKAYVVGTTLFAGFPMTYASYTVEVIVKFLLLNLVWIPIHLAWLYAGVMVQRMNLPPHQQRLINFAMAGAMLVVVGLAFWNAPAI